MVDAGKHSLETGGEFTAHAEHFVDAAAEKRAAQLGMWLFLAQEILLFGGLFCAFTVYRFLYHDTFRYLARTGRPTRLAGCSRRRAG